MSDLKPCPFCGGEANTLHRPHVIDWRYSVGCDDDECRGFIGLSWLYKTEAEAIAAWNTRVPHGTLTAEQVRKAVYAHSIHADCADADFKAIADELNSRAERTCKNVDDHKTVWFICSVCGYQQKLSHTRSYCPNCGAKVTPKHSEILRSEVSE